jgi:hypothetical protein
MMRRARQLLDTAPQYYASTHLRLLVVRLVQPLEVVGQQRQEVLALSREPGVVST